VADRNVIRAYAEAMFQIAEAEGELQVVEDQLYSIAKLAETDARVGAAIVDTSLPAENKRALVRDILGDGANPTAINVFGFIVEQDHGRDAGRIIEELGNVAAERRQHALAEVRSAVPLDEEHRRRLIEALSRATGKTVELQVFVDPSVVGGVVARVGDEVFDGTVRTRLGEAKEHLSRSS
jgi:F-type H+-transporting ATPase subunit delta